MTHFPQGAGRGNSSGVIHVDHANPVHDGFCRCRACKPGFPSSYRDVLSSRERQRVDGTGSVWPLRLSDLPSRLPASTKDSRNVG